MKARQLIGFATLNEARQLVDKQVPIATITRMLGLDNLMHYRTAYNLIKADVNGYDDVTRPPWLSAEPKVQMAPEGWALVGGLTAQGLWQLQEGR